MLEYPTHSSFGRQPENRQQSEDPNRLAYHSILGLGYFPQTPEDLPQHFALPYDIAVSVAGKAIRGHGKQEFSWDITYDPQSQSFRESEVLPGRKFNTGLREMGRFFLKSYFGSPSLAFVHNHPSGIHSPGSRELESLIANQRRTFMFITCSIWGISCLTQTAASMRTPFSSVVRSVIASDQLPTLETLPDVARRFGIGYYSWNVPENLAHIGDDMLLSMQEGTMSVTLERQERKSFSHQYCLQRNRES